ncbi:MAG: protein kinase [Pyrinomonadaceae bacterium]
MNSENWQKIEEAVTLLYEMPNPRRQAWLAEFCDGNPDLRAEIESLLAFQLQSENFLEKSADEYAAKILVESQSDLFGKKFGIYKIIGEIGQGGMGAVFLAQRDDGEFRQQVALKIIRQQLAGSEIIRRFRQEREILASLNHPHIARLLDGGISDDGSPFFVMEYVAGESLMNFASQQNLSLEDRLKLFGEICGAVAYAHRNLIVHRDLKPSNILVETDGTPKLLDFGLAKFLDKNLTGAALEDTATAFRAMTPAYASPEQLRGERVTTASDIYSLGLVLYELLTGHKAYNFKTNNLDEIIRIVNETTPAKPSVAETKKNGSAEENPKSKIQNPKLLRGDLDNIVLQALRKEPERRYKSVEAFADDIERHLDGLPVSARPNTFAYRAEKFIGRNRLGVAASLLIILALLGGGATTVWQARRAETQRLKAEKRFDDVRRLSNSLMFEIHDSVQNLPGSTPTRQLIVSRALEYLDSLAQEAGDDPTLQIELATAYGKIGDIQGNPYSANLGDTKGALLSYQKGVGILENLHAANVTKEAQMALGRSYRALGDINDVEGNSPECINNYRHSLTIFEQVAAQNKDDRQSQDELARAFETLGDGLSRSENSAAERLSNYQKTLSIRESLVNTFSSDPKLRRSLALAYLKVGGAMGENYHEAEVNLRKAIKILEDLSASDPNDARARRDVGFAYFQLGNILTEAQDFSTALDARRKAFIIRQEISANDPQNKQARFDLAAAYADLSESLTNTGDSEQALRNARESQTILEKLSADDPENNIYRRNVGLSYEKFALAYARTAADEKFPLAERIKNWMNARDWYQKTRQIFIELRDHQTLQPRDTGQIDKFSAKIGFCDEAVAQLNSSH